MYSTWVHHHLASSHHQVLKGINYIVRGLLLCFHLTAEVGSLLWVDKYRPHSTRNIIGQQGDRSNAKKLAIWLQNWNKNHGGGEMGGAKRPPWGGGGTRDQDGSSFKAALLSGPPGIGKTSTATLVCKVGTLVQPTHSGKLQI